MNRVEQLDDLEQALLLSLEGWQSGMWTAMPAEVTKYTPEKGTVEVQITIQARATDQLGKLSWITIKPLVDCPVVFPAGGGYTLTFPINVGDECLVVLASRCIDAWWQSSGVQPQADFRMHDLSDGFVIPGPRSVPKVISPTPRTDGVELRSDTRDAYVRIDTATRNVDVVSTSKVTITAPEVVVTASSKITLDTPLIHATGSLQVDGGIHANGDIVADDISLQHHKHGEVTSGPSDTGESIP